jgi:two-component system chemotaxis sensor kinase CheA
MNEFLNQFVIESREFVEQATEGLLKLERTPDNPELLDAVFRAFHTLKGGAGIVEFPAMEHAVHAAETVLSDARSGRHPLTGQGVGDCLSCLDQVAKWLDSIEHSGTLPVNSGAAAEAIVRRFDATAQATPGTPLQGKAADQAWAAALLRRHPSLAAQALTALRFEPDADCFFRAEDPVARLTALPGLLALELEPEDESVALHTLDPYRCTLTLRALTAAAAAAVEQHMRGCAGDFELAVLGAPSAALSTPTLSERARAVLTAQAALLRDIKVQNFHGRVAAAGRAAANILRFSHLQHLAERVTHATEQSLAENSIQPLHAALAQVLTGSIQPPSSPVEPPQRAEAATRTLRVDAARIDALVRLTSELTVAKNALGHLAKIAAAGGNSLAGALKERHGVLERLVSELQTQVLGMRVLPLRSVLQRFPRLVRELSLNLGKPLRLEVEGDETEADKAIVEMLFEPLTHIVRNAIDHGIETAEQRAQRGKPATAVLRIRAAREGDQVRVEVRDDGAGVDVERVRQVALERGVATEERLRAMAPEDIIELIFAPGFSTATQLTELSGRGVGMDAVRTAVERVGGRVSIDSQTGVGTSIQILLPFSVMMTRVMTVEAGEQIFGIALDAIVETVRVPSSSIAGVGAARALVVREHTVPVLELASAVGIVRAASRDPEATLVIVAAAGQWAAIQVDRLGEQMEVILQPLDGLLAGTPGIAGTTLLGDGRVLLVLDIGALLQ